MTSSSLYSGDTYFLNGYLLLSAGQHLAVLAFGGSDGNGRGVGRLFLFFFSPPLLGEDCCLGAGWLRPLAGA